MKLLSLLIFTLLFVFTNEDKDLIGKWKLAKIEISEKVIIPKKMDYFLTISSDNFAYNLAVNKCSVDVKIIDNSFIEFAKVACTEICCDGTMDSISDYINYSGSFEVSDSNLVIQNESGTYYLERH
jgi:hypothetical protein